MGFLAANNMKAFRFLFIVLISCLYTGIIQAQEIRDTTTLRHRINTDIVPNNARLISGGQLNLILNGMMNVMSTTNIGKVKPGPITSLPALGYNPNTTDVAEWINAVFYRSQAPTASLSGGTTLELMEAGAALPFTLNWTAGRLGGTSALATIIVAGNQKTFSQPNAPGTVAGTQAVSVNRNVTNTFSMTVTTVDNQTTTVTVTINFSPKRYFGWVTTPTPPDFDILATTGELSASNAKTWTQAAPGGSKFLMYAYPASEGDLTHFDINGFPSIEAMTLIKRNLTTAAGFTQLYNIYVSKNAFTVTGTTSVVAN